MTDRILTILLIYNSITDIKSKTIFIWPNVLAGLMGLYWRGCDLTGGWIVLIAGVIPGMLLWIAAYVFPDAIGKGDGVLFLMTGCWLDLKANMGLLTVTCFLAGIISGVLLFLKKANRKTEIPLAPVILAAYVSGRFV